MPTNNLQNQRLQTSSGSRICHTFLCGIDGWCYRFNVIDVFAKQWLAFVLESRATRHDTIMAVNNAVTTVVPIPPGLTLRVDNEFQYTSREFRA